MPEIPHKQKQQEQQLPFKSTGDFSAFFSCLELHHSSPQTHLVLLQGQDLVSCCPAANHLPAAVERGQAQPGGTRAKALQPPEFQHKELPPRSQGRFFNKGSASRAGSTEGARAAPEGDAAARLQADGAAARLVQRVALEDDVAVGVGHQQVQAEVKASPAPAVLQDRGDTG